MTSAEPVTWAGSCFWLMMSDASASIRAMTRKSAASFASAERGRGQQRADPRVRH
jgi:hypothetical protein